MVAARQTGILRIIFVLTAVCLLNIQAQAKYSGGMGEPNAPYQIATAADLMLLGESPEDYSKHFILTADIDLDPNLPDLRVFDKAVVSPMFSAYFSGVFDGSGHVIRNLHIHGDGCLGLFGRLGLGGKIANLGLESADVKGTDTHVGGLVGINKDGSIADSYSTGTIAGSQMVGGLVGASGGSIASSYSTATVTGKECVGGLLGGNDGGITNSFSAGTATGSENVGGLVGDNFGSIIVASYSTGAAIGSNGVGGLVGRNLRGSVITASYSTGTATGEDRTGGLVGDNWGSIAMSYSTSAVSGDTRVGGLVGANEEGSILSGSFWDVETSGRTSSAGGVGLTTAEMQEVATYLNAGWDLVDEVLGGTCDYWQISPGDYPRLRCPAGAGWPMPEGLGTVEEPYRIRDARDLGTVWLRPFAHYRLETSVSLSETTWSLAVVPWFAGSFDGDGHTIVNLRIEGGDCLGLFGRLGPGARVSGLGVEAVDVNGTGDCAGGLAARNDGSITTSYSSGRVAGQDDIGGLVGLNEVASSITACYSTGAVDGNAGVGGLVGHNEVASSITTSYSTATVSGSNRVGGLVGWNFLGGISASHSTGTTSGQAEIGGLVGENCGIINASYSTGKVTGTASWVGGLVGLNEFGDITASHSTGMVTGKADVGGLVGFNDGEITTSYSTSTVIGNECIGGLVGCNYHSAYFSRIATSYSAGIAVGNERVGGLVGENYLNGRITTSYSTATVSGDEDVGGLVGQNFYGNVSASYSTGVVTGTDDALGGLVGSNYGAVDSAFWDVQTSGQASSAGGTGRTTAEMQTAGTFLDTGWDFVGETANGPEDIWWILEGQDYPHLWWELVSEDLAKADEN